MGVSRIKSLIADGLSAIITITIRLGLGYFGGNRLLALRKGITRVHYILILGLVMLVAGWVVLRSFRDRGKSKELSRTKVIPHPRGHGNSPLLPEWVVG